MGCEIESHQLFEKLLRSFFKIKLSNPGPCTPHFFECVYDHGYLVSYEYFCPGGTVFDIRFNVCNYPHDVPVS
jgi:hypothetical protein